MADSNQSVSTKLERKNIVPYKGKKLRIAIIGCGGICQAHMKAYEKIQEAEVVAGCDILQERLDIMNEKWGVPKENLFIDGTQKPWLAMFKAMKGKIDAVDVCTPNGVHAPAVIDACNAGLHAMTEKPMAMTVKECKDMIAAAKKNGVKLSVGFQRRYQHNSENLAKMRADGFFGDIMLVKVRACRRRGIPNWGVFGQKKLQGGGPLIDIGVHIIESAMAFLGNPKPVYASANTWTFLGDKPSQVMSMWPGWDHKTYTVEDFAAGQIRFENGTIMQIEASFADHQKEHDVEDWWAYGTKAGCNWSTSEIYTDQNNMMVNMAPVFMPDSGWDYIFERKLRNWVEGCLKGTELGASGEIGLNVQKILCGLYDSAKAGHEVRIKD
ncbi:MAG: Gfo/Idh/MocA family oxidoreductase [Kiritimatiellae bacterium]|nr:Gfo/Idh/MocA family oxidoreductase [Kiritimatiellia bacterium]